MNLYVIDATDDTTLHVFAHDANQATGIFGAYHLFNDLPPPPDAVLRRVNPHSSGLNPQHLADALETGIVGVGRYDGERWIITAPEQFGGEA